VLIDIGIGIREKEMSLKEEIIHYMKLYEDNYKMAADMVILRIEKRIDDLITEVMKKNGTEIRENGNRIDFRIIYDDQIAILKQVKEMLK
jgi:hypothetical protein